MMIKIALIYPILTNVQFDEKLGKKVIDDGKPPSHGMEFAASLE